MNLGVVHTQGNTSETFTIRLILYHNIAVKYHYVNMGIRIEERYSINYFMKCFTHLVRYNLYFC